MLRKKICVVIPTKNEQATIGQVIEQVRVEIAALGHDLVGIIVTDDSKDQTRRIAKQLGATVVVGGGKGLGNAMFKGLKAAASFHPDIIVSMDADGQSDLKEIGRFIEPIINDEADFVLGSRFQEKGLIHYHYRWKNRTGIRILVKILCSLTKLPLTDSHGGLRAMIPEVARELEMTGTHTYVQETIIDAYEKGFRIKEIPSAWAARESGSSRVVSSIPVYVFYTLPVLILRSGNHIKFLYPFGLFFLFLAVLDFLIVGIDVNFNFMKMLDRQTFHMILMLVSIGLNMFFMGFVLELIHRIKGRLDKQEN